MIAQEPLANALRMHQSVAAQDGLDVLAFLLGVAADRLETQDAALREIIVTRAAHVCRDRARAALKATS